MQNTTRQFTFSITYPCCYPEVELKSPMDGYIIYTLKPIFTWEQVNEDFDNSTIHYDLYLSKNLTLVKSISKNAFITTLNDTTKFDYPVNLTDKNIYYWAVIPNDGITLGKCISGIYEFKIDTTIPKPVAIPKYPKNNQIINKDYITLQWDLIYDSKEPVYYELYFSLDSDEIKSQSLEPFAILAQKTYEIKNLYFERTYYWKVRPYTQMVIGNFSNIFSFVVSKKIPTINLSSPANNTIIIPRNNLTLRWDINYFQPLKIDCILFWGTSPTFDQVTGINAGANESYIISGLQKKTYYWKVVPKYGALNGKESETWTFTIKDIKVPRCVLIEPNNTTIYSSVIVFSWDVEYDGDFDQSKVWYELYLDNSSNDIDKMKRVTPENYKQSYYTAVLDFEEDVTYNWYVIPHYVTEDGHITGICQNGVLYFKFGSNCSTFYKVSLKLNTNKLEIDQGAHKLVYLIIQNLGNQETSINITATVDGTEQIIAQPDLKVAVLGEHVEQNILLHIMTLANALPGNYNITLRATAQESNTVWDEDTIMVTVNDPHYPPPPEEETTALSMELLFSLLLTVVIIVLISLFLYTIIKRHCLLEQKEHEISYDINMEHPGDDAELHQIYKKNRYI